MLVEPDPDGRAAVPYTGLQCAHLTSAFSPLMCPQCEREQRDCWDLGGWRNRWAQSVISNNGSFSDLMTELFSWSQMQT